MQLQKVDPPEAVIAAFRDVQAARADRERAINEAQAYANSILPRARGDAARIEREAEGYRQEVVARRCTNSSRKLVAPAVLTAWEHGSGPDDRREQARLFLPAKAKRPTGEDVIPVASAHTPLDPVPSKEPAILRGSSV